jgi:predicted DNA-binding protein YlxM (UPF0122 family)
VIESAPNLDDPDPFDLCLQGEMKAHLAEAISRLSEREQLIISLYYRDELTMKEISEVVGVALSRVSQIRQEVMKKLRESLAHIKERPKTEVRLQEDIMSLHNQERIAVPLKKPANARRQKTGGQQRSVHPCDFRAAGRLSNETARTLTKLHDAFARHVVSALDAYLGTDVAIKLLSLDQLPIQEHAAAIPPLSYVVPLSLGAMPGM